MSTPQLVSYSIIAAGAVSILLGSFLNYGFVLIFVWMVIGNAIAYSLRCKYCQKQLVKSKDGIFIRGWGWGKCDFCGKDQ